MELKITSIEFQKPTPIGPVGALQDYVTSLMPGANGCTELIEYRSGVLARIEGRDDVELFPWGALAHVRGTLVTEEAKRQAAVAAELAATPMPTEKKGK